ncbi:zinc finger protein [Oryctes borbonicus]|uniref:Zinc finger protein n=1 Tax=Oryctes borbonicus TaxID=1629725 RepID=A0A0T6AZ50_9SCAR|nr:zinc finger protein [Oryctes borbonicus]
MGSSADELSPQTVEEQCIFIGTSLLDVENIDEWIVKGDNFLLRNDEIKNNMINQKLDPLFNQRNCMDKSSDDEMIQHSQSITPNIFKIDRNVYQIQKDNVDKITDRINDIEVKVSLGLNVSFIYCDSKVLVMFQNDQQMKVLPECFISTVEMGMHLFKQNEKQSIVELNRIKVVKDIDLEIPCLITNNGFKLYLCSQYNCNEGFVRSGNAKLHVLVHIGYKPYACDYPNCTWAFYTMCKLKRHQETHLNKKDFVCTLEGCMRRFTTIYNLNNHKRLHERPADLPCPVMGCKVKFQTIRLRERHLKSHDRSEAPFQCLMLNCSKTFFSDTALATHMKTHSHKESEIRCKWPNCGKVFEHPCRLKAHQRNHTGQKPYSCMFENCKWTFSTASKLRRHQSIHTNDRKFHCTIGTCNKSFLRSEHLKEHTLTHIGQKNYQCEVCATNFLAKSTLCLHINKYHPEQNACARALPYPQNVEKPSSEVLLEQAIQSLGVPSDMILGTGLLPEEPLELLENENFSTVNLRDLD